MREGRQQKCWEVAFSVYNERAGERMGTSIVCHVRTVVVNVRVAPVPSVSAAAETAIPFRSVGKASVTPGPPL